MVNNPAFVAEIQRVLTQAAATVRFQAPGIEVQPALFDAVIQAISTTRDPDNSFVAVRSGQQLPSSHPDRQTGGVYLPAQDWMAFEFVRPITLQDEATIVHEAIHAACDIFSISLAVQDFEVVAYLAEEMFVRFRRWPGSIGDTRFIHRDPIRSVASSVVAAFSQQPGVPPAIPQVSAGDMSRMRIAVESVYQHDRPTIHEFVNGIPGFTAVVSYQVTEPNPARPRVRRPRRIRAPRRR